MVGRHVAQARAAHGRQGGAHGRAVAVACGRGKTEEGEREVDEGGLDYKLQKR
jgi:hypothetical protein